MLNFVDRMKAKIKFKDGEVYCAFCGNNRSLILKRMTTGFDKLKYGIKPGSRVLVHIQNFPSPFCLIVPGEGSEAESEGWEYIMPLCSQDCTTNANQLLQESGEIELLNVN